MNSNYETLLDLIIKAEVEGKPKHELILDICDTPDCLLAAGLEQRRIVLPARVVGKIYFDHGITKGVIQRLPDLICNARAVFSSSTTTGNVVVLTLENKGVDPIIVAIQKDWDYGRTMAHKVASMYGKQGPDPEKKWTAEGLLLWSKPQK